MNDSLLRLWKTGADLFQHKSEEDGSLDVGSGQIPNDYTIILLVYITYVAYSICDRIWENRPNRWFGQN